MPRYNVQKRKRLDNLALKHVRRMRSLIKSDMARRSNKILFQLDQDNKTFEGDVSNIRERSDLILENHRFEVVRAGVSDGIQEVTPMNELGLWKLVPEDSDPIITLNEIAPRLAEKRDKLSRGIEKKVAQRNKFSISALRNKVLSQYLSSLRAGFRDLASDWIAGEGSIRDVIDMLSLAFNRTNAEATRIFRTETTNYFNLSRNDYFRENTVMDFMQLFALTDGRISNICESRHEFVMRIERSTLRKFSPAFHPHCRTIQRPLTSRLPSHQRLIQKGLRISESSFVPLPKGWI